MLAMAEQFVGDWDKGRDAVSWIDRGDTHREIFYQIYLASCRLGIEEFAMDRPALKRVFFSKKKQKVKTEE